MAAERLQLRQLKSLKSNLLFVALLLFLTLLLPGQVPAQARLSPKQFVTAFTHIEDADLRVSMYLACLEMIQTGTTCCLNHVVTRTDEASIRAYAEPAIELGFRQIIAKEMRHAPPKLLFSDPTLSVETTHSLDEELASVEEIVRKWDGAGDGLIRMALAIETTAHWLAVGATSVELIQRGAELADRMDLKIADHVDAGQIYPKGRYQQLRQERGMSDIAFLVRLGVLDDKWLLMHHLWIEDPEIFMMAEAGASGVAVPVEESVRGGGISPILRMLKAGVNVALGTDGPMLDNSVDMVEVLKFTSALHNVHHLNPRALPAERVLEMATINAARALGMEEEIGSLEPGKKADITIFDMDRPEWIPMHNPIQTLVYSAGGESVETVLIDGRVVMENRKVQTVDEKEILHQVKTLAPAVAQRAGLEPQTSWTLV